jgi:hypothetical protein
MGLEPFTEGSQSRAALDHGSGREGVRARAAPEHAPEQHKRLRRGRGRVPGAGGYGGGPEVDVVGAGGGGAVEDGAGVARARGRSDEGDGRAGGEREAPVKELRVELPRRRRGRRVASEAGKERRELRRRHGNERGRRVYQCRAAAVLWCWSAVTFVPLLDSKFQNKKIARINL